jgi:hypothetical protein
MIENDSRPLDGMSGLRKGKLRGRRVPAEEFPMHLARDREARAHFGAVGAAPLVGEVGSFDEPAAAFLFHRPAFEGINPGAIVEHGSVLRREHQGQNPGCLFRVGGIIRTEFEVAGVVVDFPKELIVPELKASEVVFAVRVVVGAKGVERRDRSDGRRANVARQGVDARRQNHAAERRIEGLSKLVVEFANAFARFIVSERHVLLHEVDVP